MTTPSDPTAAYRSSVNFILKRIFVRARGIRAGWSVLIFAAVFWVLRTVVFAVLGHFIALDPAGPMPPSLGIVLESCQVLVLVVTTLAVARIERRSILSYGYLGYHKLIRLVSGSFIGFFCISLLVGALWKSGFLAFSGVLLGRLTACNYGLAWAVVFLLVGFFEESLLRGYLQFTRTRGIGFWWSALLLSIVFALGHVGNNGETVLGIIEVGTSGLIFCLSLWYTKSLWWAAGFHAGWDWGQSFCYGTPDSGLLITGHLLASYPSGNPLWSGGTDGPEGSILILPLVAIIAIGMWLWWGVKKKLPESGGIFASGVPLDNR